MAWTSTSKSEEKKRYSDSQRGGSLTSRGRSLKPLYLALVDPDSTENLRRNREKLSEDITELINEYGPKVFSDFDPQNVFRKDPSGNKQSVSELGEGGWTFSQIAADLLENKNAALDWLDDRNIFNWSKQQDNEQDDSLHFLDKHNSAFSGTSASEAESSRAISRKRLRNRGKAPLAALTSVERLKRE